MPVKKLSDLPQKISSDNGDGFVITSVTGQDMRVPFQNLRENLGVDDLEDKASLLTQKDAELDGKIESLESTQAAGAIAFATKAIMDADLNHDEGTIGRVMNDTTDANNAYYRKDGASGSGSWIKQATLSDPATIKQWVTAESFDISNIVYSPDGNIATADIVWPDTELGTISNLVEDSEGRATSLRFNRPLSKYITVDLTYNSDGNVATTTLTATGY